MPDTPAQLLTRAPKFPHPMVQVMGDFKLRTGRVHELCGAARRSLAVIVAQHMQGPVFWISPAWQADRLNGQGLVRFVNPGRVTFVRPQKTPDLLWCMEEVLRAGCVPLVVVELPDPPALTPVRRLNLAAEHGATKGPAPLGVLLCPGDGGAAGVDSRWHFARTRAAQGKSRVRWHLSRRRDRTAPPATWDVTPRLKITNQTSPTYSLSPHAS